MRDLAAKIVILGDDGLATGSSIRAAILALRRLEPARVVVAVPAAPGSTCEQLRLEVDEVVCATTPSPFFAVGRSYWDFTQTTDEEVRDLLRAAARVAVGGGGRAGPPSQVALVRMSAGIVAGGGPPDDAPFRLLAQPRVGPSASTSRCLPSFYAAPAHMTQ